MRFPGFEWDKIDWTNAVYLPLILAIPFAFAVPIYTGVIVTRLGVFSDIKGRAIREISDLRRALLATANLQEAIVMLSGFLEEPKVAFAACDQWSAARLLKKVSVEFRNHFKERFEAEAVAAGYTDREHVVGDPWRAMQFKIMNESVPFIGERVKLLDELGPDMWRVTNLRVRNRTLNRIDRFLGRGRDGRDHDVI